MKRPRADARARGGGKPQVAQRHPTTTHHIRITGASIVTSGRCHGRRLANQPRGAGDQRHPNAVEDQRYEVGELMLVNDAERRDVGQLVAASSGHPKIPRFGPGPARRGPPEP